MPASRASSRKCHTVSSRNHSLTDSKSPLESATTKSRKITRRGAFPQPSGTSITLSSPSLLVFFITSHPPVNFVIHKSMMAAARRSCQRNCWMLAFGGSETLVRKPWTRHNRSMNRTRISTTVDTELLYAARSVAVGKTDASLIDEALSVLLDRYGSVAEIDTSYAAYDRQPLDEPDAWGDLGSFREAARRG